MLVGAAFDVERLLRWFGGLPRAAAVGAWVLLAVGLAHVLRARSHWSAVALGAAGLGLSIASVVTDLADPSPSVTTLIGVTATSAAILLIELGAPVAAQVVSLCAGVVGGLAVLAFVYGDRLTTIERSSLPNTDTSAPIAYALLFAAVAGFAATPDSGITAWVTHDSPGRRTVRRLLPAVIALPLVLAGIGRWIGLEDSVGAPRAWAIVMSALALGIVAIAAVAVPLIDRLAGRALDAEVAEVRLAMAERDSRIAQLAQDLAVAVTPDDVAAAVGLGLTDTLGARAASYGIIDHRRGVLVMQHGPSVDPALAERYSAIPLDRSLAVTDAARSAAPVFIADAAEYLQRYPSSDVSIDELGAGARAALPLKDRAGVTFGALIVAWDAEAGLEDGLVPTITTVAELVAQSVERAQLAHDLARDARRQGALAELAESLAGAGTLREVLDRLAERGAAPLDGVDSVVGLIDRGGRRLRRYFAPSTPDEVRRLGEMAELSSDSPLVATARTGEPVLLPDRETVATAHPELLERFDAAGFGATANLPLRNRDGQLVGAIGFGWDRPVTFDPSLRILMSTVAELAAQSIQRAWLSDERGRDANRAGQLSSMAESLAATATVQAVVDVVARDGPAVLGADTALLDVSGSPLVAGDPTDRRSTVVPVPSLDDQRTLATVHLTWRDELREDEGFRARLGTLVELVSQTLERVRLSEAEHRLVADLQARTLRLIPAIAGIEVVGRYEPAAVELGMGGDWFEVVELGPGLVGLVVGDVVGHGVEAAAEMSQISAVLRTVLSLGTPLETFFARVHDVAGTPTPRFVATASVCVLDVSTGLLRYVSAGHPAPVVRCADGTTALLSGGRSPVVGMPPRDVEPGEWVLGEGDTLFVYTDGLVERRGEDLDAGLDRLRRHLATLSGTDVAAQASELVARCTAGGRIEDDIALVALRRSA